MLTAGAWHHVVGEHTTKGQPADCADTASIDLGVDGVKGDHASHGQTGRFRQYQVVPEAGPSPLDVGSMAQDSWFLGAIGKVAVSPR